MTARKDGQGVKGCLYKVSVRFRPPHKVKFRSASVILATVSRKGRLQRKFFDRLRDKTSESERSGETAIHDPHRGVNSYTRIERTHGEYT